MTYPPIGIKLHNQTYDFIYSCHNNSQSRSANASLLGSADELVVCNLFPLSEGSEEQVPIAV